MGVWIYSQFYEMGSLDPKFPEAHSIMCKSHSLIIPETQITFQDLYIINSVDLASS